MAEYRNDAKGARTIKLTGGGYVLVEAGATVEVPDSRIARVGPGLVAVPSQVTKASAKAVAAVTGAKPNARRAPAKRKAAAKPKAG
jgi:hypothetical protein